MPTLEREPKLAEDLEWLDRVIRGDPRSPLRRTSKSGAKLAEALRERAMTRSSESCCGCLKAKGYSLQADKKTREGAQRPDRNAKFAHIAEIVSEAPAAGEPAISVDAKKRELVSNSKPAGRELRPGERPAEAAVRLRRRNSRSA